MPNALSPETIAALLKLDNSKKEVRAGIGSLLCECGSRRNNGYCHNSDCPIDAPIPTLECDSCGHCPNPGKCVQSVVCPRCEASTGNLCMEGNRLVGFHESRWLLVKEEYGTYYK